MDDLAAVRAEILSSATEDLTGVYEAWWTANVMRPHLVLRGWSAATTRRTDTRDAIPICEARPPR